MIVKLNPSVLSNYARHTERKVASEASYKEKVKYDRWVMILIYCIGIIATVIFS